MPYTTSFVTIRNSSNNVGQNYPKDIAVPIIKIAKINTIITGILPRKKTYSFLRQKKIDETNQMLKVKCENLSKIISCIKITVESRATCY